MSKINCMLRYSKILRGVLAMKVRKSFYGCLAVLAFEYELLA